MAVDSIQFTDLEVRLRIASKIDGIMRANGFAFIDNPESSEDQLEFHNKNGLLVVIKLTGNQLHVSTQSPAMYLDSGTQTYAQAPIATVIQCDDETAMSNNLDSFLSSLVLETPISASNEHPWVAKGEEQISALANLWTQIADGILICRNAVSSALESAVSTATKHPFLTYASAPVIAALLAKLNNPQMDFNGPVGNAIIVCCLITALVSAELSIILPPDDSD